MPSRSPSVPEPCHDAPAPGGAIAPRRAHSGWRVAADALAFSSGLATAVGAGLSLVASRALGAESAGHWATLSATGTFIIYNLDRLRDIERDRATSPGRTDFIVRHRRSLQIGVAIAALAFAIALWMAPRAVQALCLAIGVVGLLHRRLKRKAALKTLYVSAAWVASCVGIPWLAAGRPIAGLWLAGILLLVLGANLIASNLRDDESPLARAQPRTILAIALACTTLALALALVAPDPLGGVAWIAGLEGLALAGFRAGERYGLLVVDGALLVGSVFAWLQLG